ncbi:pyruvate dehydrogenase E2 component (dihydrolipoamide acetyltransferase) [Okibacterium sp. HSC-33S16]|uniref:dihydrolipoamide acetyltransferase family protein n=1 Tax=Okibacterium sp. HSC-33S16 TaxID=2910965 RepID=UPI00209FE8AF|nr:dihydrolipoamide acetyltransferase family protein [Okibacterium sp. HSC-33S16]MCP2031912.1 pyruvate dehydrogenase E2 component (dihydrolipoamide acetyltransferase) [Okibacterium sp. HSC-33S16]
MSVVNFALPDLGEGLTESEIVAWRVAVGDTVALNQVIAEVETAKALVELPSPFAGTVSRLFADEGATVNVGEPIVAFDVPGGDDDVPTSGAPEPVDAAGDADARGAANTMTTDAAGSVSDDANDSESPSAPSDAQGLGERESVLVGYGPRVDGGARPKRRARTWRDEERAPDAGQHADEGAVRAREAEHVAPEGEHAERPRSTPPVRKFARDRGIDLATVFGTGENGLITREDVERAGETGPQASALLSSVQGGERASGGRGSRRQDVRVPIRGVRKATAEAMVRSAFTAPHVTEFLTIDVTAGVDLVRALGETAEFRGKRLSILTLVAKAVILAAARTPAVNSRWDDQAQEIVLLGAVHLGIAAATGRGLIVPNIKDADTLSLSELRDALDDLIENARAGTTSPRSLTGGTLTITNVGVFGVDAGTPILNPGEAAILAMGAVRRQPWQYAGEIALREVMTLSLSFDHRLVDGEQGSRFLVDVGTILSNPAMVLTMV